MNFSQIGKYEEYLIEHPFHIDLKVDLQNRGNLEKKAVYSANFAVNPDNWEPFAPELDDLIRLHYLVVSRKVTTILEFGVGKSTIVFDNALEINKNRHQNYVLENLRRNNPFECHSVDNSVHWIEEVSRSYPTKNVSYHYSKCRVTSFNDRICTLYDELPNICPDFIYLDAPDQFSPEGNVRSISTNHPDRLPMAADILAFEHFLLPGTLIVVDGRTANARFLKSNLQRNWRYTYSVDYDQHFFELLELPLGPYNKQQIEYCLGTAWFDELAKEIK